MSTDHVHFTSEELSQFNQEIQKQINAAPTDAEKLRLAVIKFDTNKRWYDANRSAVRYGRTL